MLGNALARKSKPGMRRKRDDDEMSDEELARELEGWVEVRFSSPVPRLYS